MNEKVKIGNIYIDMKATGNTPRLYRETFGKDLIVELGNFRKHIQTIDGEAVLVGDFDMGVIERLGYIMAKQAHSANTDTIDDWLDQFTPFDISAGMGEILNVWSGSTNTTSEQKKSTES